MVKKKIYILLTRFPDNGSRAVSFFSGGAYPHASIGLEEDMNTFYSFITKGFIIESVARYLKPDRAPFPCQLYELEVSPRVYNRVKEILTYFIEFKDLLHYTRWGVTLSLLHIPYKRNRFGFFCTQFVAYVLQNSGAAKLRKSSTRFFSNDLKRLPGMKLDFQGDHRSFLQRFKPEACLSQ